MKNTAIKKLSEKIKTTAAKLKEMRAELRALKEQEKAESPALVKKLATKKKRGRKPKKQ